MGWFELWVSMTLTLPHSDAGSPVELDFIWGSRSSDL